MRKLIFAICALLILPSEGWAQESARRNSGSLSATGSVSINTMGMGTVGAQITGTYSGTHAFEGTLDETNWVAINCTPPSSVTPATTTTSTGAWTCAVGGLRQFRVRMSIYTSGTSVISLVATAGGSGVPAVSVSGTVTVSDLSTLATADNQPVPGIAGTPSADVITIQGASGTTPIRALLTDVNGTAITFTNDSTHDSAASTTGPQLMGECDDTSTDAVDEGDAGKVRVDCTTRAVMTRTVDPCSAKAKTFHIVNMSSATTVEIANAVASEFFHICSVNLVAAGAQTLAIGEDDTDGCGSITAGLHGGATAATGWSFAANGGIALGNGQGTVMKTATAARYLCVITGQAVQISGTISYVSALP